MKKIFCLTITLFLLGSLPVKSELQVGQTCINALKNGTILHVHGSQQSSQKFYDVMEKEGLWHIITFRTSSKKVNIQCWLYD